MGDIFFYLSGKVVFAITTLFLSSPGSEAKRAASVHCCQLSLSIMSVVAGNHNRAGAEAA